MTQAPPVVRQARSVAPAPRVTVRRERATGFSPGFALAELGGLLGVYLLLHVAYDLLLWSTVLRGVPLSFDDPALFFRARVLGSPGGLDLYVYATLFLGAWIGAFVYGRVRHDLSFRASFGLFILAYFFLRATYGFLPDLQTVADPGSVAPTIPRDVLYRIVIAKLFREFVLPAFGLLLLFGAVPGIQSTGAATGAKVRAAFAKARVRFEQGPLVDTMHGLWLFFVVLWLAIGATQLANQWLSTGDESQVFVEMTPDLAILLSFAAGFGEEFAYRALLFTFLLWAFGAHRATGRQAWPRVTGALLAQAVFFGLIHAGYGNLAHIVTPFLFGLIAGIIFLRFGFVPAFLVHFLLDVVAFAAPLADDDAAIGFGLALLIFGGLFVSVVFFLIRALDRIEKYAELIGRIVVR